MLWVARIMNSVFTERVQIEKNVGKHFPRLRYEYLMSESFDTILMNQHIVSLEIYSNLKVFI